MLAAAGDCKIPRNNGCVLKRGGSTESGLWCPFLDQNGLSKATTPGHCAVNTMCRSHITWRSFNETKTMCQKNTNAHVCSYNDPGKIWFQLRVGEQICRFNGIIHTFRKQRKQESHAVARKPCDAAAVLFGLKFADNIHYKFKSSQASKAMLRSSKHTDANQNLTQNGHSRSFKITCFGVS